MKYMSNSSLGTISDSSQIEISYTFPMDLCNKQQTNDEIAVDYICRDRMKCTSGTQTCAKLWDSMIKERLSHSIDFMREISYRNLITHSCSPGKLNNGMPSSCLLRKYQYPNKLYRIRKRLQSQEDVRSKSMKRSESIGMPSRNRVKFSNKLKNEPSKFLNSYTYPSNHGNLLGDKDELLSAEGMKHSVPHSMIPSPYIPSDEETYLLNIQSYDLYSPNKKFKDSHHADEFNLPYTMKVSELGRNSPDGLVTIQCNKIDENLSVNCTSNPTELYSSTPNSLCVPYASFISLHDDPKTVCRRISTKLSGDNAFYKNEGERGRNCGKVLQKHQLKQDKKMSVKRSSLTKSSVDVFQCSELVSVYKNDAYLKHKSPNELKKQKRMGTKKRSVSSNLIRPLSTPSHPQHHPAYAPKRSKSTYSHHVNKQKQDRNAENKSGKTMSVSRSDPTSLNKHRRQSSPEDGACFSQNKKHYLSLLPVRQKIYDTAFLTREHILKPSEYASSDVYIMLGAENHYSLISYHTRHNQEYTLDLPAISSLFLPLINRDCFSSLRHSVNRPDKLKQNCVPYSTEQQTDTDSFNNDDISILMLQPIIVKYGLQTFMSQSLENLQILNSKVDFNQPCSRCMPVIPLIKKRITTSFNVVHSQCRQPMSRLVYYSPVNHKLRDYWTDDKSASCFNFSELIQSNLIWIMIRCEKVINQTHVCQLITSMYLNNTYLMQIPIECLNHHKNICNIEKLNSDILSKTMKKGSENQKNTDKLLQDKAAITPPPPPAPPTIISTDLVPRTLLLEHHSYGLPSSSASCRTEVHTPRKNSTSICKKLMNFLFCYSGNFSSASSISYTYYNSDISLYDSNDFLNNSKSDLIYLLVNE